MRSDYTEKSDYSDFRPLGFPVRHKRKVPFYPMLSMDLDMREKIREMHRLDSALDEYILSEEDYRNLVTDVYSSNIHWSTRIEGNRLSSEDVLVLTQRFTGGVVEDDLNDSEQEILNHLGSLFQDLPALPWTVDTVLSVHRTLMKDVGETTPGILRDVDVSVKGSDGTEYFIACPKGSVPEELESLVDWVNNSPFGDVVTATLFFHEFESIHPFEDGNGRTGRVLFQTLLRLLGLTNCHLCRFEEKMLGDTTTYYDLLAYTDQTGNYTPLVRYVTESLLSSYREAVDVFSEKDRLKDMDENMRHMAIMAKRYKRFTLGDTAGRIHLSEPVRRNRLDELVKLGIIGKEGRTRSMHYVFLDPFRWLKTDLQRTKSSEQNQL